MALSLLGYTPAKGTEPEFLEAMDKIVDTAKRYGKKVGLFVTDGEAAREARERFDFVALGTDVRALQSFYTQALKQARS